MRRLIWTVALTTRKPFTSALRQEDRLNALVPEPQPILAHLAFDPVGGRVEAREQAPFALATPEADLQIPAALILGRSVSGAHEDGNELVAHKAKPCLFRAPMAAEPNGPK